jgi:hypothetical protein
MFHASMKLKNTKRTGYNKYKDWRQIKQQSRQIQIVAAKKSCMAPQY